MAVWNGVLAQVAHEGWILFLFGVVSQFVFQSRFYVQWYVSERQKKSVVPVAFWYLSCIGTLLVFVYTLLTKSPVGALSYALNIIPYTRNLVHIWQNAGKLTKRMYRMVHVLLVIIALGAVAGVAMVWLNVYHVNKVAPAGEVAKPWFWIAVGTLGTAFFGGRFIIQWIATERARASVIPTAFWYLSVIAAALQLSAYLGCSEWVLAAGSVVSLLISGRNIWFIHQSGGATSTADVA